MGEPVFEITKDVKNNAPAETMGGYDGICLTDTLREDAAYIEEDGYPAPYRNILKNN